MLLWAFLVAQMVKNLPTMWETWVRSLVGKIPWRRAWQPTPVLWPGESPRTQEPGGLQSTGSQKSLTGLRVLVHTQNLRIFGFLMV